MKNVPNRNEGFYWLSLFRLHNFITYYSVGNADLTELVGLISTNGFFLSYRFERKSHLFYSCLLWVLWFLVLITILKGAASHPRNGALNVKCLAYFRQLTFPFFPVFHLMTASHSAWFIWMLHTSAPSTHAPVASGILFGCTFFRA